MISDKLFDNLSYKLKIQLFTLIRSSKSRKNQSIDYESNKTNKCVNTISNKINENCLKEGNHKVTKQKLKSEINHLKQALQRDN